jgi:quercetin dioxygenase-like cupin family protein
MEIKRNDATVNRPEGSRVIDAPYVFMDIPSYTEQLKREKSWDKNDRNGITVFKSDKVTMVLTMLKAGAEVRRNSDYGYLTLQVIKGEISIITSDEEFAVAEGRAIAFHPNVVHSFRAISDTTLLQTSFCRS